MLRMKGRILAYVVEKLVWKSPILGRFDLVVGSASVIFAILAFLLPPLQSAFRNLALCAPERWS